MSTTNVTGTPASDHELLSRAVDLARRGVELGDGGPFGALIACDGQVLAEGWNQVVRLNDPTAHAEVMAIRNACALLGHFHLNGYTLYTSSEPCPMCLSAAYWARIDRIVYANPRSEADAIGFCDADLFDQLCLSEAQRTLSMEHLVVPGALEPLQRWMNHPNRIDY